MSIWKAAGVASLLSVAPLAANAATVDVVQAPSGFFVPDESLTNNSLYYRRAAQDWGWTHGALAAGFTTASLLISAYDVDFVSASNPPGERDEIFAMDDGVWVSLGYLTGASGIYAYTEFTLTENFFNDIESGLNVRIDIDSGNDGWRVTLAKSVITTNGAAPPPAEPGVVPLPAAGWLMLAGLGGLAALRRRKTA